MLTRARVARIFEACRTPGRALRASERVRGLGLAHLADALWCQAAALRTAGYPEAQRTYRAARDAALAEHDGAATIPTRHESGGAGAVFP